MIGGRVLSSSASAGAGAAGSEPLAPAPVSAVRAALALWAVNGESAIKSLIWSRDSGPGRYDNAHRLVKVVGLLALAECNTNSRFARPEMVLSIVSMSVAPAASLSPSINRALSRSVCRRPIIHVPALAIAL